MCNRWQEHPGMDIMCNEWQEHAGMEHVRKGRSTPI